MLFFVDVLDTGDFLGVCICMGVFVPVCVCGGQRSPLVGVPQCHSFCFLGLGCLTGLELAE